MPADSIDGSSARPGHDDTWTVLAIACVCYVGAKIVHEAVGHGVVCHLVGADWVGVSSAWNKCDYVSCGDWAVRAEKAGGTCANLVCGLVAALCLRLRNLSAATRYFVWLTAVVHLLMGAGYLLVDPLIGFGDWGRFIEGLQPQLAWQLGLTAVGAAMYIATAFAAARWLEPFLGGTPGRRRRALRLTLLPYVCVGGVLLTTAALLNSEGPEFALTSAMATVGGTSGLAWLGTIPDGKSTSAPPPLGIARSVSWLVAGAVSVVFVLTVFGPGIHW